MITENLITKVMIHWMIYHCSYINIFCFKSNVNSRPSPLDAPMVMNYPS